MKCTSHIFGPDIQLASPVLFPVCCVQTESCEAGLAVRFLSFSLWEWHGLVDCKISQLPTEGNGCNSPQGFPHHVWRTGQYSCSLFLTLSYGVFPLLAMPSRAVPSQFAFPLGVERPTALILDPLLSRAKPHRVRLQTHRMTSKILSLL